MSATMRSKPSNASHTALFRQEAVSALRAQPYGDITLVPGASSRWVALAGFCIMAALLALISIGSYTRRTTVGGQVYPSEGLIRVVAAQPGTIVEQLVQDGQTVKRGSVLFVLSGDRLGSDNHDYQRSIATQIESRRRSLEDDLKRSTQSEQQEADQVKRRLTSLRAEQEQVARQAQQLTGRVSGAEEALKRYEGLFKQDFVSKDELLAKETEVAEVRSRMQGNKRDMLVLERDLAATQRDLETQRARFSSQRSELDRSILSTRQEFSELEAKRRIVVTAPADGQITLLQAELGQSVEPGRPLAQVVPTTNQLTVRLYAPSKSAGFVQVGAPVLLRFDAFPYQKYGQLTGKVVSVSKAAVSAADIQGYTPRADVAGEPLFAITVSLPEQMLGVGDSTQKLQLQSGMRVEADLMHETRRLYEWILEPLYAARSRL
jgi:membrane fusion protein